MVPHLFPALADANSILRFVHSADKCKQIWYLFSIVARHCIFFRHRFAVLHLPSATVSKTTFLPLLLTLSGPPASIHLCRFLHWLTSKSSRSLQPSTTASTPVPVTRTQPRTERWRSSRRCSEMHRRDVSDTAEPQKARLRWVSIGRPRARTSVAVSDSAQQNDYWNVSRCGQKD